MSPHSVPCERSVKRTLVAMCALRSSSLSPGRSLGITPEFVEEIFTMRLVSRLILAMMLTLGTVTSFGVASAQDDDSEEIRIIVVTHGQASDPFWSVVQKGVEQAGKDMNASVEYQAPTTYDMVEM